MEQDTGRFRQNTLDKYYTSPTIAQHCVQTLLNLRPTLATGSGWAEPNRNPVSAELCSDGTPDQVEDEHSSAETASATTYWIEPAVGGGVFLETLLRQHTETTSTTFRFLGIDLEPHVSENLVIQGVKIHQGDFLTMQPAQLNALFVSQTSSTPPITPTAPTIVFLGNPPFGRQSATARAFIRHSAALRADLIAFILPRSFVKPSFQRAFPPQYHLLHNTELPPDAFTVNGLPHHVPCVFQIWEKRQEERPPTIATTVVGFRYVKSTEPHHLIIRRVGVNAGRARLPPAQTSPSSHYYIDLMEDETAAPELMARINATVFPSNTVGPRSLSKGEINDVLTPLLEEIKSDRRHRSSPARPLRGP